jgi:hypothetical protein
MNWDYKKNPQGFLYAYCRKYSVISIQFSYLSYSDSCPHSRHLSLSLSPVSPPSNSVINEISGFRRGTWHSSFSMLTYIFFLFFFGPPPPPWTLALCHNTYLWLARSHRTINSALSLMLTVHCRSQHAAARGKCDIIVSWISVILSTWRTLSNARTANGVVLVNMDVVLLIHFKLAARIDIVCGSRVGTFPHLLPEA